MPMPDSIRTHIEVQGLVQGVGFRPYVKRLADGYGLKGWVRNTSSGAEMQLEGERGSIEAMLDALMRNPPELAQIDSCRRLQDLPCEGAQEFIIMHSAALGFNDAQVTPDAATCPDCLRELFDPGDRRHRYPFINCTNCGPRFTILRDIPYDRCSTSMAGFAMCERCAAEYADPADRRFHAQPDCCAECGPQLRFLNGEREEIPGDPILLAQQSLAEGKIIAVKGLGGYHLACRADDPQIIAQLRSRKRRDEKPFALMARDPAAARSICLVSEAEERALKSSRAPIVLLKKLPSAPEGVSENRWIGVMLPYTPLHHLLMQAFDLLVMTSANLSDQPALIDDARALEDLRGIADGYLIHNRPIQTRCDDSLIRIHKNEEYPIRRSRGYAPQAILTDVNVNGIIALGAEQKASFALGKGQRAYPAQHIGDLKNIETLQHYRQQIDHFRRIFGVEITGIACDLHPDYLSGETARELAKPGIPIVQVQHHHAHMVSCMADNRRYEPCIGLCWDGTGLGTDGDIWGAECLAGDAKGFVRLGSIRPIALPGGDKCMHEIYRTAASLLMDAGEAIPASLCLSPLEEKLFGMGMHPRASSMGRLFDGAYALITGRRCVSYEGQGAILLETLADACRRSYPCETCLENGILRLDTRPLIRALMQDLRKGCTPGEMAAAFMNTLIELGRIQCIYAREKTGLNTVMLSGGTFQNIYLLSGLEDVLSAEGFDVCRHRRVPCNDAGIALGQLIIAANQNLEG